MLFQAIRWRLIRSPVGRQRQLVLQLLIDHDIFGCKTKRQPSFMASLIQSNDPVLTIEHLRLISVMASDHKGREYLLGPDSAAIQDLFNILSTLPGTTIHRKEGLCFLLKTAPSVCVLHRQTASRDATWQRQTRATCCTCPVCDPFTQLWAAGYIIDMQGTR